jgi:hypothetical protein
MSATTTTPAATPERAACLCGCGGVPTGKGGRFLPGHDGRLKGQLLAQARGGSEAERDEAARVLAFFGWSHFLIERAKDRNKRLAAERRAAREAEAAAAEAAKAERAAQPAPPAPRAGGDDPSEDELAAIRALARQRKADRAERERLAREAQAS